MRTRSLGSNGPAVSVLGYGTGGLGDPQADLAAARDVFDTLVDLGVNLIDTAACYGQAEAHLGRWLDGKRDRLVIVSKCGHHDILADGSMRSRAISLADIDAALQRLRTDYLDAMLLHSYDRDLLEAGDALRVLEQAKQQGKIRAFGYSGDNDTAACAATLPGLSVIETSANLVDQANLDSVVPAAAAHGVGVIAKRPLANAVWRFADTPLEKIPAHPREYARRFQAMHLDPQALGLPGDDPAHWADLALRFTLAAPGITSAIVGTSNPARARQNVEAASRPLDPAVYQTLRTAFTAAARDEAWPGEN